MTQYKRIKRTEANFAEILSYSKPTANGCIEWQRTTDTKGYGSLWVGGKNRSVHRLVAMLLIPNPNALPCVLHSCDNPPCINPEHLRWGTVTENNAERDAKGRAVIPNNQGSRHGMAKLDEAKVLEIKTLLAQGQAQKYVADRYCVSASAISAISRGVRWGWLELSEV